MRRPRRRRREQQRGRRGRGWRPQGLRLPQPCRGGGVLGGPDPPRLARRLAYGAPAARAAVRGRGSRLRPALRPQVHLQVRLPGLRLRGQSYATPAARGQLGASGVEGCLSSSGKSSLTLPATTGLTFPAAAVPHSPSSAWRRFQGAALYQLCTEGVWPCF